MYFVFGCSASVLRENIGSSYEINISQVCEQGVSSSSFSIPPSRRLGSLSYITYQCRIKNSISKNILQLKFVLLQVNMSERKESSVLRCPLPVRESESAAR